MAITAGAVVIEVDLDTKRVLKSLASLKAQIKSALSDKRNQGQEMEQVNQSIEKTRKHMKHASIDMRASVRSFFKELEKTSSFETMNKNIEGMRKHFVHSTIAMRAAMGRMQGMVMPTGGGAAPTGGGMAPTGGGGGGGGGATPGRGITPGPLDIRGLEQQSNLLDAVNGRLLMLSAAVAYTFKRAVEAGARFENEMQKVKAVVGANDTELKVLTDTARHLGKTTTWTAGEIATAMKILGQAGFKTKEIQQAISAVTNVARAGAAELSAAANITLAVANTFDMAASDFARVGDILIQTANNSATNIQLLGGSFNYMGSTAATVGQKLEHMASLLGVLANRGMTGTKAGTALNEALRRLATTDVTEKLKAMGVAVEDVKGNMRPLAQIFFELDKSLAGYTNVERAAKFVHLFGIRGARAGLLISRASGDVAQMAKVMAEADGVAQKTARGMEQDLLSKFRLVASAAEELAIAFKDSIKPSLMEVAQRIQSLLVYFSELLEAHSFLGTAVTALAATLSILGSALVGVKYIIVPLIGLIGAAKVALFGYSAAALAAAASSDVLTGATTRLAMAKKGLFTGATLTAIKAFGVLILGLSAPVIAVAAAIALLVYGGYELLKMNADTAISTQRYNDKVKELLGTMKELDAVSAKQLVIEVVMKMVKEEKSTDDIKKELEGQLDFQKHFLETQLATEKRIGGERLALEEKMKEKREKIFDHAAGTGIGGKVTAFDSAMMEKYKEELKEMETLLKGLDNDYSLFSKHGKDAAAYIKEVEKALADVNKAIAEAGGADLSELQAEQARRRTEALAEVQKKMEDMEKDHQKRLQNIRERYEEKTRSATFRKWLDTAPDTAISLAEGRKGEMETNLKGATSSATMLEGIRDQLKKELSEETGVLDTTKLAELENVNKQLDEVYSKIAEYTQLILDAEDERLEAVKAESDAMLKAAMDLRKFRDDYWDKSEKQDESTAKAQENVTKSRDDFKERMEGIKSIAMASTGRGGSLSEKLGGTSSTIQLNKKELELQRKQLVKLEELVTLEKTKKNELMATYK